MSITSHDSTSLAPVAAYDLVAPHYDSILATRKRYLTAIEEILIAHSAGARSLLDVGAGNGVRALRIARATGIDDVVLLEPSAGMRAQCPDRAEFWNCAATEIPQTTRRFDLITCLWNTLGHFESTDERIAVLARLKTLLTPSGRIFLDANHRYNARAYGWPRTAVRMLYDFFSPAETNGNVLVSWKEGDRQICTRGHVFTQQELLHIFSRSGLAVKSRWVVDYCTGELHANPTLGNLLYQLQALQ